MEREGEREREEKEREREMEREKEGGLDMGHYLDVCASASYLKACWWMVDSRTARMPSGFLCRLRWAQAACVPLGGRVTRAWREFGFELGTSSLNASGWMVDPRMARIEV